MVREQSKIDEKPEDIKTKEVKIETEEQSQQPKYVQVPVEIEINMSVLNRKLNVLLEQQAALMDFLARLFLPEQEPEKTEDKKA